MSPWDFKVGQVIGYRPRGEKYRARVTAIEYGGKPSLGEIPIVDQEGDPIRYEDPPSIVSPILDYENYFIVLDVNGKATDPWLAARLDHQDPGDAWRLFAERIGIRDPYYQALASVMEKWAQEGRRGEFLDDLMVLLHAAWRAGAATENQECARLLQKICEQRGVICLASCTHAEDSKAIKNRLKELR